MAIFTVHCITAQIYIYIYIRGFLVHIYKTVLFSEKSESFYVIIRLISEGANCAY